MTTMTQTQSVRLNKVQDWRDVVSVGVPTEIIVHPHVALEMLERNTNNRKLSERNVDFLAAEFAAGRAVFDGSPIRFDGEGNLIDGQHRLNAVVRSGVPIRAIIIGGLDDSARETIDTGRGRKLQDVLSMEGKKNEQLVAAAIRMVAACTNDAGLSANDSGVKISNARGVQILHENPDIENSVAWYYEQPSDVRMYLPASACFCHWILNRRCGHPGTAWLTGVIEGKGLRDGDSRVPLRSALIKSIGIGRANWTTRRAQVAMTIKAWNCHVSGRPMTLAKFGRNDVFPMPLPVS